MPWSSGTFSRVHDWTTDAGSAIDIEASRMDAEDDSFAAGIDTCLTKDGQNEPTADLPMGGMRHTGVANATARNHYASAGQLIDQSLVYYNDTGAADAYVITPSPAITAYADGQKFSVRTVNANTGASTLNVNGLGATSIRYPDGTALSSGAFVNGGVYELTYRSPNFYLTSSPAEIPDAMLSSNVPLLTAGASFGGSITAAGELRAESTQAQITMIETDASADNGRWRLNAQDRRFTMGAVNDANSVATSWVVVDRTGTTVDEVEFSASTVSTNNADVSFQSSGVEKVFFDVSANRFEVRDGWSFRIYDATDADYLQMQHGGTNFGFSFVGTNYADFSGVTSGYRFFEQVRIADGSELRVYDATNTDHVSITHNGSDAVMTGVNTTNLNLIDMGLQVGGVTFDSLNVRNVLHKVSSTSRASTTTRTIDPHLSFGSLTLLSGEYYAVTGLLVCNSVSAAPGISIEWSFDGSAIIDGAVSYIDTEETTQTVNDNWGSANSFQIPASGQNLITISGVITSSVDSEVGLLWAQSGVNVVATTLEAGSFIRIERIS